jgi:hypothetical protein
MGAIDEMARIKEERELDLLELPNVVGVGLGARYVDGEPTDEPAIVVSVERKLPKSDLTDEAIVPARIEGIRTDVVQTGAFELDQENWRARRPLDAGAGIGVAHTGGDYSTGTLGVFAMDAKNRLYGLTNNHVACVPTNVTGSIVHQPATVHGGSWKTDRIGWVNNAVPLAGGGAWNWADMASIAIERIDLCTAVHPGIKRPLRGHYPGVGLNWQLWKVGAKTGYTQGWVRATHHTMTSEYDGVKIILKDQVMIRGEGGARPSAGGDSGSVWATMDHYAAALHAGSSPDGFAVAAHVGTVLGTWSLKVWSRSSRDGELVEGEMADSDEIVARPDPRAIEDLRARTVSSEAPVEGAPAR